MTKSPIFLEYQIHFTESPLEWICGGDQAYFQVSTNKQTFLDSSYNGETNVAVISVFLLQHTY